jgi:serine/threonine-protein kinase
MDFITRDQLVAAMNAWVLEKHKPLGEILVAQGALRPEDHALLEPMVARHIQIHGGEAEQSLAAISSSGLVPAMLGGTADPDLEASLRGLERTQSGGGIESASLRTATVEGDAVPAGSRFRILRFHAEGGLGRVYVAHDQELHREVALKQIKDEHAGSPERRARFVVEAEITGGLEHPGVVPVYGLGQHPDGRPFYAMRLIQGDNLRDAIKRFHGAESSSRDPGERTLELRRLLGRFLDVCDAVAYAHSRGVLHRDLKPGNIMLGKFGETLVVDWGLAKSVGRPDVARSEGELTLRPESGSGVKSTEIGAQVGTPAYMSPEQAAGRLDELGQASDVYSLGATLYCLLTGKPPFADCDLAELLAQVERGEFAPPAAVNPRVDGGLEAICKKAMALRPRDRYTSPRELAEDIEHWLADEPLAALSEPLPARARRWLRRHRTIVTAASVALVVAAAGLAITLAVQVRATERERSAQKQALAMRNHARSMLNALVDDVQKALQDAPATQALRRRLLQTAIDHLGKLVEADAGMEPGRTRAVALICMGRIHMEFEQSPQAQQLYQRACDIGENQARTAGAAPLYLVDSYVGLAWSLELQGEIKEASDVLRKAEGIVESRPATSWDDTEVLDSLLDLWEGQADIALELNDRTSARRICRKIVERAGSLPALAATLAARRHVATALETLATLDMKEQRLDEAREGFDRFFRLRKALAQEAGERFWAQLDLGRANYQLGRFALITARPEEAVDHFLNGWKLLERLSEVDRQSARLQHFTAQTAQELAIAYAMRDDSETARVWSDRSIKTFRRLVDRRVELASCYADRGWLERAALNPEAALPWLEQALALFEPMQSKLDPWFSSQIPILRQDIEECRAVMQEIMLLKTENSSPDGGARETIPHAVALACLGRHAEAAKIADKFSGRDVADPEAIYRIALVYANCRVAVVHNRRPDELDQESRASRARYAAHALEMLDRAVNQGLRDAVRVRDDFKLIALYPLPQFQSLIARLFKTTSSAR